MGKKKSSEIPWRTWNFLCVIDWAFTLQERETLKIYEHERF